MRLNILVCNVILPLRRLRILVLDKQQQQHNPVSSLLLMFTIFEFVHSQRTPKAEGT